MKKWLTKIGLKVGINYANKYVEEYYGMKTKKKFGQTTVGKILKGAVGLINPVLGDVVNGKAGVEEVLSSIKAAPVSAEDKARAQELVLEAYEAEVNDRIAARSREARVAAAGGSDILFKVVGFGITFAFLMIVAGALGFWEVAEDQQRLFDMAFGAVVAQMTAVVSYYFGSSMGSKQKSQLLDQAQKDLEA